MDRSLLATDTLAEFLPVVLRRRCRSADASGQAVDAQPGADGEHRERQHVARLREPRSTPQPRPQRTQLAHRGPTTHDGEHQRHNGPDVHRDMPGFASGGTPTLIVTAQRSVDGLDHSLQPISHRGHSPAIVLDRGSEFRRDGCARLRA